MNSSTERRAAPRVRCHLPLRLHAQGRQILAEAQDLSRHGVCVQLPLAQIQLTTAADVDAIARALERLFSETLVAELRYDVLGPLVRRALRVVRIGRVDVERGTVEIGCLLRTALRDAEIAVLGIDLPPAERELPVEVLQDDEGPASQGPWTAYLAAAPDRAAPPLHAKSATIEASTESFRLEFTDARRLPIDSDRNEPGHMLSALVRTYGSEPTLLLLEGDTPLWGGPARVFGLELGQGDSPELTLSLQAGRRLTPGEQIRLGLLC